MTDAPDIRAEILARATRAGLTITTAESCTGGMVAAALTDLPGSSAMFERGFVTYSNAAKTDLLGVSPDTLAAHGAVSEAVAGEMAAGARQQARADIAVAVTGIAGPGGSEFKPEGRVCFGLNYGSEALVETMDFGTLGRDAVRRAARDHALNLILSALP
ncbi:CinA family protein [Roseovarius nubinhibens]|uniref:Putative competence-damaged inducible protein n=2 Tax=Roseovarius nubinhibens TaxID=314263 RepID=A3SPX6_ROSNI|nr:CinA family protein [Roseovarius nubinhibens]EAP76516.1 Putative competence-damaged inducible protein [Roseovarius nubinhibens ISM]